MFPTDMDIQSVQYISRLFSISEICGTTKEIGMLPAHCVAYRFILAVIEEISGGGTSNRLDIHAVGNEDPVFSYNVGGNHPIPVSVRESSNTAFNVGIGGCSMTLSHSCGGSMPTEGKVFAHILYISRPKHGWH